MKKVRMDNLYSALIDGALVLGLYVGLSKSFRRFYNSKVVENAMNNVENLERGRLRGLSEGYRVGKKLS